MPCPNGNGETTPPTDLAYVLLCFHSGFMSPSHLYEDIPDHGSIWIKQNKTKKTQTGNMKEKSLFPRGLSLKQLAEFGKLSICF